MFFTYTEMILLLGVLVGATVGVVVGFIVGDAVGLAEGVVVGLAEGVVVGFAEGVAVPCGVGVYTGLDGAFVGYSCELPDPGLLVEVG